MQLLLLLILALTGGSADALKEVKPVIESLGGGEALDVIERAEELSSVITAVQSLAGGTGGNGGKGKGGFPLGAYGGEEFSQHGFPLAPISEIADENITYCLSRYISLGE